MAKQYKVNDNLQVFIGEKRYVGGETFSASDDQLDEHGARPYVTEVRQQAKAPGANKAVAAPEPHEAKQADKEESKPPAKEAAKGK